MGNFECSLLFPGVEISLCASGTSSRSWVCVRVLPLPTDCERTAVYAVQAAVHALQHMQDRSQRFGQFLFGLRSRRSQSAHGALVRRRKCLSHWMWMPLPLGEFLSAVGLNYHQCREGKKTYLTMYIVKYACCDLLLMFCKNIDAHYPFFDVISICSIINITIRVNNILLRLQLLTSLTFFFKFLIPV